MGDRSTMENALLGMSIVTWIFGGGMLGVGIYLVIDNDVFEKTEIVDPGSGAPPMWASAVYLMLASGALSFAIGFVGWIGTLFQNRSCLLAYVIVSSITMGCMIAGGSLGVVYMGQVNGDDVADNMLDHLINDYTETSSNDTLYFDTWTTFQSENQCCGAGNYTDWLLNDEFTDLTPNPIPVPESCCNIDAEANSTGDPLQECFDEALMHPDTFVYLYDQPCSEAFSDDMNVYTAIVYGISFGTFAFSLVSTALAGVVYSDYRKNKITP